MNILFSGPSLGLTLVQIRLVWAWLCLAQYENFWIKTRAFPIDTSSYGAKGSVFHRLYRIMQLTIGDTIPSNRNKDTANCF